MKTASFARIRLGITAGFCIAVMLFVPFTSAISDQTSSQTVTEPYQYHTYDALTDELHSLQENYSSLMSLSSIGKTYEGRDLWMVKLSDNVETEEEEPGVLFMAAHHGNEWPGVEICLFFIRYMLENAQNSSLPEVQNVLNTTQIYLIPMVNPDGVTADTRKNCAPNHGPFGKKPTITSYGVNLNRNYDDPWFLAYLFPLRYYLPMILPDASFNYRGPYPFSENETQAVKHFTEAHNFSISISYHSYGEFIIYPWMHTTKQTPDEMLFRSVGENISLINGYYLLVKNDRLIPLYGGTLGSSENWLYREKGALAYTVEVGNERRPTSPQVVFNLCMTQTTVHLYLCQRAQTIESEKAALHQT
ncbi:MAG TPA: zinc carboxypeptidase [Thermoplasmata archaeon]|jgi:carboxypeptidase T|nr:zinc carboxypeptidase [Thermoplasmata archaeon]HIH29524.1 zinc carboxypeptidase [Thermoplasmata archaeon]